MGKREDRILKAAEEAMESESTEGLKESLLNLLKIYKKLSERTDKILKQSDRQQDAMFRMNEELTKVKEQQDKDIDSLIEDKKKRAKNILESKRKIYEVHKKEIMEYKSSVDNLTNVLVEKDALEKKYKLLEAEYQKLKAVVKTAKPSEDEEIGQFELQDALDILKERGLENEILKLTEESLRSNVIEGGMENIQFSRNFLRSLKSCIAKDFIAQHIAGVSHEKIAAHIVRSYAEDILSVVADTIIQKAAKKVATAVKFLNFYNGDITFSSSGEKLKKPDIMDVDGNRWVSSSIYQIASQRDGALKQLKEKREIVERSTKKLNEDSGILARNRTKAEKLQKELQENKIASDATFLELKKLKDEYLELKTRVNKKSKDQKLQVQFEEARDRMLEVETEDKHMQKRRDEIKKELEEIELESVTLRKDVEGYKKMLGTEKSKLMLLEEGLMPLDEKYDTIISAFVKAMLKFISGKGS